MDLLTRQPPLDLYDRDWPFRAWQPPVPPAKSVHSFTEKDPQPGILANSIIGGGSIVSGAKVVAELVEQTRGAKVIAFKKRRRKNSRRKRGHRQDLTKVRIRNIVGA